MSLSELSVSAGAADSERCVTITIDRIDSSTTAHSTLRCRLLCGARLQPISPARPRKVVVRGACPVLPGRTGRASIRSRCRCACRAVHGYAARQQAEQTARKESNSGGPPGAPCLRVWDVGVGAWGCLWRHYGRTRQHMAKCVVGDCATAADHEGGTLLDRFAHVFYPVSSGFMLQRRGVQRQIALHHTARRHPGGQA